MEMINEMLYMENRLFRMFQDQYHTTPARTNQIFNAHQIWNYIEQTYDMLHLNGDESALAEIVSLLRVNGAVL